MVVTRRALLRKWLPPAQESWGSPPALQRPPVVRPPGALPEPEFLVACDACGQCLGACPHDALLGLSAEFGAAAGTPAVDPNNAPCRLCPDMPCVGACPTPALRPTPIAAVRMGSIVPRAKQCWAAQGQPCDYCVTACPLEQPAIEVTASGPKIDSARCVGCGACVFYCAASPRALAVGP